MKGVKGAKVSKPISKGSKRPPRHPAAVGSTPATTPSSSALHHHVVEAGAGATPSSSSSSSSSATKPVSSESRGSTGGFNGFNGFTSRAGWWDDVNIETDRASSSGLPRHGLHESHGGHGGHGSPHEGRGVGRKGSKGRGGGGIGNSKSSSRNSSRSSGRHNSATASSGRSRENPTNKGLVLEVYGIDRCPISAEVTEDLRGHLETKLSSMTLAKLRSLLGTSRAVKQLIYLVYNGANGL